MNWKRSYCSNYPIDVLSIMARCCTEVRPESAPAPTAVGGIQRSQSTTDFGPEGEDKRIEYFFASDASAIIEHTNR